MKNNKHKLENPIKMKKNQFVNSIDDENHLQHVNKGRTHTVTFTLNARDIELLEKQVDRAIILGKRNKSKSAIIRMSLRALANTSDDKYLNLYDIF